LSLAPWACPCAAFEGELAYEKDPSHKEIEGIMEAIVSTESTAIVSAPLSQNPAAVYLARLTSQHSRRTMQAALQAIADLLVSSQRLDQAERAEQAQPGSAQPSAVELAKANSQGERPNFVGERSPVFDFPWSALRYQHTGAIRAKLLDRYAPATVNKLLSALRGCLPIGLESTRRSKIIARCG
jgi:hypothetical protein